MAFDDMAITNGRIHIVRDRDGRLNLPESSNTPAGEPAALDVRRVSAPRLLVDFADAQNDMAVAIPGLTLDIGRDSGRVTLNAPATIRIANKQTQISTLDGGAAFDGRALKLNSVALRADEASLQVDGTVSLLVSEPSLDVRTERPISNSSRAGGSTRGSGPAAPSPLMFGRMDRSATLSRRSTRPRPASTGSNSV